MIAKFFQSLNSSNVDYLLISGQATVLYGAATFSEDVDLWINPTEGNCEEFLNTLRDLQARYYKLTPALTVEHLLYGHGFHFVLPGSDAGGIFLDVMGNPPRAGTFPESFAGARWMETEWGAIRTIGIKPLVELKKTQRLEDYPIISRLALAWFEQPECAGTSADFVWAFQNIFTLSELTVFLAEHPTALVAAQDLFQGEIADYCRRFLTDGEVEENLELEAGRVLQSRISGLQQADRHYWRGIIQKLKELRAAGSLMKEGQLVSADF